jgi:hypothetical protein
VTGDEDELDLEAVRATDLELDDIAAGGTGSDDRLARLLVAWRDAGRKGEPVAIDWQRVELADLYIRMTSDGMLFLGVGPTQTPNSPDELLAGRVPTNVQGVLLDADQRRELAYRLLAIDES